MELNNEFCIDIAKVNLKTELILKYTQISSLNDD